MKLWLSIGLIGGILCAPLFAAGERLSLHADKKMDVPVSFQQQSMLPAGNQAVLLGGFSGKLSCPGLNRTITRIDPNNGGVAKTELAEPVPALAAATVWNQDIFVAGGVSADGRISDRLWKITPAGLAVPLGALPEPLAGATLAVHENELWLIGGAQSLEPLRLSGKIYVRSLTVPESGWRELAHKEAFPPVMLASASVQNKMLHVFGGYELENGKITASAKVWRHRPGGWNDAGFSRRDDAPYPLGKVEIARIGITHYGLIGMREQRVFDTPEQLFNAGGVKPEMQIFNNVTERFFRVPMPSISADTVFAAELAKVFIGIGGQNISEPGVLVVSRDKGCFYTYKLEKSRLNWFDYLLIALYGGILVWIGIHFAGKNQTSSDYFVGGHKMPMWVAAISSQAAGASGITMMALPAMAYQTNLLYWGVLFYGIIPAVLTAVFIIPVIRKLNMISCYEYLESRYCRGIRQISSAMFLFTMLFLRLSSVTLLPAMAICAVTGLNIYLCILVTGIFSTVYTVFGGINSVAFSDVFQFALMTGGAILCVVLMISGTTGGLPAFIDIAAKFDKWTMFDISWDHTIPTVWLLLITQPLMMFTPMSDPGFVQRVMAVKDVREAKQVTVTSFLLAIPIQSAMWIIGVGLFVFFYQHPEFFDPTMAPDSSFPQFIVERLPVGVRGLLIIGILAASISTINSGINSSGAVLTSDFFRQWKRDCGEKELLRYSKILTAFCGVVATGATIVLATVPTGSLWELITRLSALVMGGFPSIFMLGILTRRGNTWGAIGGWIVSMGVVALIQKYTDISFIYYAALALIVAFATGYLISIVTGGNRKNLDGLTVFTGKSN